MSRLYKKTSADCWQEIIEKAKPNRYKGMVVSEPGVKRKRETRKKYKKQTRETGILKKETYQYWADIQEKAKKIEYKEDFSKINRIQGKKRKREHVEQEEKEKKKLEKHKTKKSLRERKSNTMRGIERHGNISLDIEHTRVQARPSEKLKVPKQQILMFSNDEESRRTTAANTGDSLKGSLVLGTPGIHCKKGGFSKVSRPVKVNGKVRINYDSKPGARSQASGDKLTLSLDNHVQKSKSLVQTRLSRFWKFDKQGLKDT